MIVKYQQVQQKINKWDPIGLLIHTPQDEYEWEIQQIYGFVNSSPKPTKEAIGKKIYDVFSLSFGLTFNRSLSECISIAEKLW